MIIIIIIVSRDNLSREIGRKTHGSRSPRASLSPRGRDSPLRNRNRLGSNNDNNHNTNNNTTKNHNNHNNNSGRDRRLPDSCSVDRTWALRTISNLPADARCARCDATQRRARRCSIVRGSDAWHTIRSAQVRAYDDRA